MRVLVTRLAITAAAGASLLVAAAGPAWAHHPVLSGSARCSGQQNSIRWTIGNSEASSAMSITAITATMNGRTYPVLGYVSPIGPSGHTYALT
ncbi:MAG: hypothetical protein QOI55_1651, partial [Actinomycetota bacterium]|nr:hypothetical protein [Actinomycetota bacterium]